MRRVQLAYTKRRDFMVRALQEALPAKAEREPLATWNAPAAGMFLWLRQHVAKDTEELAQELIRRGVAVVPGSCFQPPGGESCPYLRITFAKATEADMQKGCRRIAEVLQHLAATEPEIKRRRLEDGH